MRSEGDTQNGRDDAATGRPLKCVWMLAGVVDYKLCDRQYECDRCPFDRALRASAPSHLRRAREALGDPILEAQPGVTVRDRMLDLIKVNSYELAGTLFYSPGHIWARVEAGGTVRIGLDDFGQKLIGRVYAVNLPEPSTQVMRGSACWQVTHRAGQSLLGAPVAGIVEQVNITLVHRPWLINRDPYGQGWALLVRPERLVENLRRLYYGSQAEQWYDQQVAALQHDLLKLMESAQPQLGATLQDGGSQVEDLTRAVAPSQLRHLIDKFLSATTGATSAGLRLRAEGGERR